MSALPETLCGTQEELEAWRALRKAREAYDVSVLDRSRTLKSLDENVENRAQALRAAQAHFDVVSRIAPAVPPAAQPANPSGVSPDGGPAPACSCHSGSVCGQACAKGWHHGGCYFMRPLPASEKWWAE